MAWIYLVLAGLLAVAWLLARTAWGRDDPSSLDSSVALALLAAAPVLGLFYVMFLPFLGFAMVLHLVGTKVAHLVGDAAAHAVRALRPSWAPALAFLTRHTPAEKPEAPAEVPTDTNARDEWKENVEATLRDHDERR